jgi:predicted Fe-S protein YdhL (DUF1289 family)
MSIIKSPCIKVCEIDHLSGFCVGCFRTLEEIGKWTVMGEGEKENVLKEVAFRKKNKND